MEKKIETHLIEFFGWRVIITYIISMQTIDNNNKAEDNIQHDNNNVNSI